MMFKKPLLLAAIGAALSAGGTAVAGAALPPVEYKIREGFTFRDDDGTVRGGGETIKLAADVAELHLHKLEPLVQADAPTAEQPKAARTRPPKPPAGDPASGAAPADASGGAGDTGAGDAGGAGAAGGADAGGAGAIDPQQ